MIWVAVLALTFSFVLCVSVSVLVSRSLARSFQAIDRMHERSGAQLDKALDRLMTIKWEDYVATQQLDEAEEGGFFTPDEQAPTVEVQEAGRWGHLSRLRDLTEAEENEQELLKEDFTREGEVVR